MPGSSNNSSFIPKRGTQKRKRRVRNGNIYVLTIVSYVILFAALAASAGVFIYSQIIQEELLVEIQAMNDATSSFDEAEMLKVQEFDTRLRQAHQRLNNSVSIVSILSAIESATIDTVRFDDLKISRRFDNEFVVQGTVQTDTFDSSIFQRGIYSDNPIVDAIEVEDLVIKETTSNTGAVGQSLSFTANIAVPISAVPYEAVSAPISVTPVEEVVVPVVEEAASTSEDVVVDEGVVDEDDNQETDI
jgi:hypothetical protein